MQNLIQARPGVDLILISIEGGQSVMQRLTDMALIPGEQLKVLHNSGNGPVTVLVKDSKLAIGHDLACKIIVKEKSKMVKEKITIALAGNPNSGKSTIFNNLTGARQHVGNYPGVTVEKKEGKATFKNYEITVVDLPGTYSLSAYSEDEVVARDFIIHERPDVIDRKSTRLNSSHIPLSRMPSSA